METLPEEYYKVFSGIVLDNLSQDALGLLRTLAFLNAASIPEELLRNQDVKPPTGCFFPKHQEGYHQARDQLLQFSLVHYDEADRSLNLHHAVQLVARQKLDSIEKVAYFKFVVALISHAWPFQSLEDRFDISRHQQCAQIFDHVLHLMSVYNQMVDSLRDIVAIRLAVAALFNDAGWYWFERGFPQECEPFFQHARSIYEALARNEKANVAHILRDFHNNQGSAANEAHNLCKSLEHNESWLRLVLERHDEYGVSVNDYELGCAYNEVGVAYAVNGRYEDAIEKFLMSVKVYQNLPEYKDTMLGWPLPNLGLMYWTLGRYDEAEETLTKILAIHEKEWGRNDTNSFKTGKILHALGNTYTSMGKHEKGLEFHLRCLDQYMVTLGETNHRVGDTYHRLADHYLHLKDYLQAKYAAGLPRIEPRLRRSRNHIREALNIFGSRPYYKHELARSMFKQGQIMAAQGKAEDSKIAFERAYSYRKALYPEDELKLDDLKEEHYDEMVVFWSR